MGVRNLIAKRKKYLFRSLYTNKTDHHPMVCFVFWASDPVDSNQVLRPCRNVWFAYPPQRDGSSLTGGKARYIRVANTQVPLFHFPCKLPIGSHFCFLSAELRLRIKSLRPIGAIMIGSHSPLGDRQARLSGGECVNIRVANTQVPLFHFPCKLPIGSHFCFLGIGPC